MKVDHAGWAFSLSPETLTITAEASFDVALMRRSRSAVELAASSTPSTVRTATESSVRVATANELADSATGLIPAPSGRPDTFPAPCVLPGRLLEYPPSTAKV